MRMCATARGLRHTKDAGAERSVQAHGGVEVATANLSDAGDDMEGEFTVWHVTERRC